jgi:hypothetical protein
MDVYKTGLIKQNIFLMSTKKLRRKKISTEELAFDFFLSAKTFKALKPNMLFAIFCKFFAHSVTTLQNNGHR